MKRLYLITLITIVLAGCQNRQPGKTIRFVSFPDFFNFDIPEPWPKYDDAVDYFLGEVKKEKPNFVMICGDLVDGRWWDSPQCVEHMGTVYFSGWVRRMEKYGLKYYTAVGDHELGDDPWPDWKVKLVPHAENIYRQYLKMPQNGPENKKGLAYYVREGDLLMITVETFEIVNDTLVVDVVGEQLRWFDQVLTEHADAKFKIVQGHVGLWGELKIRSSSMLKIRNEKESDFYQTMKKHKVDAYLAGEFHDVTVLESDGIWQIVHGSSWGRTMINTEDYLVGEVTGDELNLTLKRIYMDASGEYMWNVNKDKGPNETVTINQLTLDNGPEITGTLTIRNRNGQKEFMNRTGYFQ